MVLGVRRIWSNANIVLNPPAPDNADDELEDKLVVVTGMTQLFSYSNSAQVGEVLPAFGLDVGDETSGAGVNGVTRSIDLGEEE